MKLDEGRLTELMEESDDLHSDAMRGTHAALTEMVAKERDSRPGVTDGEDRRRFLRRSLFAAGTVGGMGALFFNRMVTDVLADSSTDVQMLQTAAAIENLAIQVYNQALALPASVNGSGNTVIAAFVTTTIKQHTDHMKAFNGALQGLNARQQTGIDQKVASTIVQPALSTLQKPGDVIGLALTLEDAAAQTYVKYAGAVDPKGAAFGPLTTIAPVEAQHAAVLRAVKALLDSGHPEMIALPPNLQTLPAAAGDVGFPDSFYKTDNARPADEGAVS